MNERTWLTPDEERVFWAWAAANGIGDVDAPESRYDYRGYWKQIASKGGDATKVYDDGVHFTDQFKQHGHPSFSVESQYSEGPWDGGRWIGESYVPPGADLLVNGRGVSRLGGDAIVRAIRALTATMGAR